MDSDRVLRTKEQARENYDFISGIYDALIAPLEQRQADMALRELDIRGGESVLEIGSGTGRALSRIAALCGKGGRASGIDISPKMCALARKRLAREGFDAAIACADATKLPYPDSSFDAVFSSFAIELFDTADMASVLSESFRVLKPGGRLVIISLSKEEPEPLLSRIYVLLHNALPSLFDCRPINAERAVGDAGFRVAASRRVSWLGVPARIVRGEKLPRR